MQKIKNFQCRKIQCKLNELKYTILRRAIITSLHTDDKFKKDYTRWELECLCYELEMKTFEELKEIHKKWIGYA